MSRRTELTLNTFGLIRAEVANPDGAAKFLEDLQRVIKADVIKPWLDKPNPGFGGLTARELLLKGMLAPLNNMLSEIRGGSLI